MENYGILLAIHYQGFCGCLDSSVILYAHSTKLKSWTKIVARIDNFNKDNVRDSIRPILDYDRFLFRATRLCQERGSNPRPQAQKIYIIIYIIINEMALEKNNTPSRYCGKENCVLNFYIIIIYNNNTHHNTPNSDQLSESYLTLAYWMETTILV